MSQFLIGPKRMLPFLPVMVLVVLIVPTAAQAAPPPHDNFANRRTISSLPFTETTVTTEATREPGEPNTDCGPIGKTVWYQFTPSTDQVLGVSTVGSDFDTLTGVWTGSALPSLTRVACSDSSSTVFFARAGTAYLIQAGGYDGDSGNLSFRLREVDAGVITGRVTEAGTGVPLPEICVDVVDADFRTSYFTDTDAAGNYEAPVRSGTYAVYFYDECDNSNDHQAEWYKDKPAFAQADEIQVTAPDLAANIDGSLTLTCPGYGYDRNKPVIGGPGPDTLTGGPEDEVFCGFAGNDRINGGGGSDIVLGHEGRDRLSGGDGRDFIWGGQGANRLSGGADRDQVVGGSGRDELTGGSDDDFVGGEQGSDLVRGGPGNDLLRGNRGADTLHGGPGKDRCRADRGRDRAGPSCERVRDVP
jgi:Ca2+-binding RTX toxin-like protein